MPGDLGERHPQLPPFGLQAFWEGLGSQCRIVAEEFYNRAELRRYGLGPVFFPIGVGVGLDAHSLGGFPLQ